MLAAGVLSGLFSAGTLALVSRAVSQTEHSSGLLLAGFIVMVVGKIGSNLASQLMLAGYSQDSILDISLALSARVIDAPLRALEQHGPARILTTLTEDVTAVAWAVQCLPQLIMNGAVVLGCAAYLAWLSWPVFLATGVLVALGTLAYRALHRRAFAVIHAARTARAALFEQFRTLTSGIKELMMHAGRRDAYLNDELHRAADRYRAYNIAAARQYALADGFTQLLFYGVIGFLLFGTSSVRSLPPQALVGYVLAMLYMMSPLWSIIGIIPALSRGQAALQQIDALGLSLEREPSSGAELAEQAVPLPARGGVQLRNAVFSYTDDGGGKPVFTLGPVDFQLHAGELVFVVGGNGSGKSTFLKVLTGLYPLQNGTLTCGGAEVADRNRRQFRQLFSVVFADFHLFETLLGLDAPGLEDVAARYLRVLHLEEKVSVSEGRFSTTSLSHGQRRRLALLIAYLENRPFYIFDEWAADQDPEYKRFFYVQLLPELRAKGKGVVVVTHDDRYFHLGDRVVKFEEGRVVSTWTPEKRPAGMVETVSKG